MKRSYEQQAVIAAPASSHGAAQPAETSTTAPSTPKTDAAEQFANYGYGPRHPIHEIRMQEEARQWAAQNAAQQAAAADAAAQAAAMAQQQAAQAYHQSLLRNATGLAPLYPSYAPDHRQFPAGPPPPPQQHASVQPMNAYPQPQPMSPPSKRQRFDSNGSLGQRYEANSTGAGASGPQVAPLPSAPPPPMPPSAVRPILDPSRGAPQRKNAFPQPYRGPGPGPMPLAPPFMPQHQGGPPMVYTGRPLPQSLPLQNSGYAMLPMRPGPPPPLPMRSNAVSMDGRRSFANGRAPLPPQRMPNVTRGQGQRGRGRGQSDRGRAKNGRNTSSSRQDDQRRAFSDFRITSIEIVEIDWYWEGTSPSRESSAAATAEEELVKTESRGKHARDDDSEEDRDGHKKVRAGSQEADTVESVTAESAVASSAAISQSLSAVDPAEANVAASTPSVADAGSLNRLPDEPTRTTQQPAVDTEPHAPLDSSTLEDVDGEPADLGSLSRPPSPSPSVASTIGKGIKKRPGAGREGNRLRIYFGGGDPTISDKSKQGRRPPIPMRPALSQQAETAAEAEDSVQSDLPPDLQAAAEAAGDDSAPAPDMLRERSVSAPPTITSDSTEPSADRISISYAKNTRRMLIDASLVESFRLFRSEHRIELDLRFTGTGLTASDTDEDETIFKGLKIEAMDVEANDFVGIDRRAIREAWGRDRKRARSESLPADGSESFIAIEDSHDELLPPLHRLQIAPKDVNDGDEESTASVALTKLSLVIQLDKAHALGEPKWARTGQVEEWIAQAAGRKRDAGAWRGKIKIMDPEPPPTFEHALKTWVDSTQLDIRREELLRFTQTHMQQPENVIEVLLRIVRGDARQDRPTHASPSTQPPAVAKMARELKAPYPSHQTHVSLATFSLYKLAVEQAGSPGSDGRQAIEKRVGEIVRALPYHLVFRVLDSMAREVLR